MLLDLGAEALNSEGCEGLKWRVVKGVASNLKAFLGPPWRRCVHRDR